MRGVFRYLRLSYNEFILLYKNFKRRFFILSENLLNLKIHKVSEETYKGGIESGSLDHTAIYLTPDPGYVTAGQKDGTALGVNATAEGTDVVAAGEASHAEGEYTIAHGDASHAEGASTTAVGSASHAEGCLTIADGLYSHAEGYGESGQYNMAIGQGSHVEGSKNTAYGDSSHTEGRNNRSIGNYSHAEGTGTVAFGPSSHTEGCSTQVATNKVSMDDNDSDIRAAWSGSNFSLAKGDASHVEGLDNLALKEYSHAEGRCTQSIGTGTHTEGHGTTASGDWSHAEGYSTHSVPSSYTMEDWKNNGFSLAEGAYSHVEGYDNMTKGVASHVEGYFNLAEGDYSHAEGKNTQASNIAAHSEGYETIASGQGSHAEGCNSTASGLYSHAEGISRRSIPSTLVNSESETKIFDIVTDWKKYASQSKYSFAGGDYSHNEGYNTLALDKESHAEGYETVAGGLGAHAEGGSTETYGISTHAEGNHTFAGALGYYIKGIGTSDTGDTLLFLSKTPSKLVNYTGNLVAGIDDTFTCTYQKNQRIRVWFSTSYNSYESYLIKDINYNVITLDRTPYTDHTTEAEIKRINLYSSKDSPIRKIFNESAPKDGVAPVGCNSHAEGCYTTASGFMSHAEGDYTAASGDGAHAEGISTEASGSSSHAEGNYTRAIGSSSHTEGAGTCAYGEASHAEGISNGSALDDIAEFTEYNVKNAWAYALTSNCDFALAYGEASHVEGKSCLALGDYTHAEGDQTDAFGEGAHAEGCLTTAYGDYAHVEGFSNRQLTNTQLNKLADTANSGWVTVLENWTGDVSGNNYASQVNNRFSLAYGRYSHVEGIDNIVLSTGSHAEGRANCIGSADGGYYSHVSGYGNVVRNSTSTVIGHLNNPVSTVDGGATGTSGDAFIIGNGYYGPNARDNAFRVMFNGNAYLGGEGKYNTSGADYAEYFEWADGNIENEDRRGYFVTMDGEKITFAKPGDYILGIVSGQPAIIGNSSECWQGRYIRDDFGATILEDYEYEETIVDPETQEAKTITKVTTRYKQNPDYDESKSYISRAERQEWAAVGMLGVLAVRDDGTCKVNGFCEVAEGGIATAATSGYRVIKRVNDNIIKVVLK